MRFIKIDLDRKTFSLLRYIRWHDGVTEGKIRSKFKEDAESRLLINFCLAGYLVAKNPQGEYVDFSNGNYVTADHFAYYVTPKTKAVLDNRFDRLWQWSIPTIISVAALIVSIIALLQK